MSKLAKRWRAAAARALRDANSLPNGSYRDIVIWTADAYERLAEAGEERLRPKLNETNVPPRSVALAWTKTGQNWVALHGPRRCEVRLPPVTNPTIRMYVKSVRIGHHSVSGGADSIVQAKLAAEREALVLKDRAKMK
jgi:hypothetical protein